MTQPTATNDNLTDLQGRPVRMYRAEFFLDLDTVEEVEVVAFDFLHTNMDRVRVRWVTGEVTWSPRKWILTILPSPL